MSSILVKLASASILRNSCSTNSVCPSRICMCSSPSLYIPYSGLYFMRVFRAFLVSAIYLPRSILSVLKSIYARIRVSSALFIVNLVCLLFGVILTTSGFLILTLIFMFWYVFHIYMYPADSPSCIFCGSIKNVSSNVFPSKLFHLSTFVSGIRKSQSDAIFVLVYPHVFLAIVTDARTSSFGISTNRSFWATDKVSDLFLCV